MGCYLVALFQRRRPRGPAETADRQAGNRLAAWNEPRGVFARLVGNGQIRHARRRQDPRGRRRRRRQIAIPVRSVHRRRRAHRAGAGAGNAIVVIRRAARSSAARSPPTFSTMRPPGRAEVRRPRRHEIGICDISYAAWVIRHCQRRLRNRARCASSLPPIWPCGW